MHCTRPRHAANSISTRFSSLMSIRFPLIGCCVRCQRIGTLFFYIHSNRLSDIEIELFSIRECTMFSVRHSGSRMRGQKANRLAAGWPSLLFSCRCDISSASLNVAHRCVYQWDKRPIISMWHKTTIFGVSVRILWDSTEGYCCHMASMLRQPTYVYLWYMPHCNT